MIIMGHGVSWQLAVGKVETIGETVQLTYRELNEKSNQLAHLLREKGVKPDSIVAIMTERSIEMLIAVLGILKAGGAYLPIEPDYPPERIDYMLKDSNARILESEVSEVSTPCPLPPASSASPSSLAYIIYTSGSTGKTKGVLVEHRNLTAYLTAFFQEFNIQSTDTAIQLTSYTFDAFIEEVFPIFLRGGKLIILKQSRLIDMDFLCRSIINYQVNIINCTPLLLNEFNKFCSTGRGYNPFKSVHTFISGGDVLKREYVDNLLKVGTVYNTYGPTESTVCATYYKCSTSTVSNIPIGKPIANYNVYIMGKDGQLLPLGVPGELCVGGEGVTRGYLNNPELTAGKFLASFSKIYKTGDLARWLADGNIEFLGRIDHQVKVRGYRIELGEIENQLLKRKEIKEAVAAVKMDENNDKHLYAYIVSAIPGSFNSTELKKFLSHSLPDYMIPSHVVEIDHIPLTANGKLDRRSLPKPEIKTSEMYAPPENETEEKLAAIWAEILHIEKEKIGINDNFFQLGGHSLKATIVMSKIYGVFGVRVPLLEIFKALTIKNLAKSIQKAGMAAFNVNGKNLALLKNGSDLSKHLFFIHDGTGEVEAYIEFCNYLKTEFNCWGIKADRLENYAPQNQTIENIARKYVEEIKRIKSSGPYYIAGWSLGGTIAFEIINQLEEAGENIAFLVLIDSPSPGRFDKILARQFTLKRELKWLRGYFSVDHILKKLNGASRLSQLWQFMVHHLEAGNIDMNRLKRTIARYDLQALPNYNQLNLKEVIYYLNMGRTLRNARASYIPAHKINTPVHFFKASQSKRNNNNGWKKYTYQPIKYYEIDGDHYSIFANPNVRQFAKVFNNAMVNNIQ